MMEQRTDAELVTLVRAGKREAFSLLIERYQPMVKRIATGMISNEEIVRELVQEAILQAYLSLTNLRDATRFKSWLYGITLNICRSYLQDQKTNVLSLEAIMGGIHHERLFLDDNIVDPQRVAEEHELHQLVFQAVQCLSAKEREATMLFYYEQLTLQEIAALLAVSVVAIKGRLHRARKQLREQLAILYTETSSNNNANQKPKAQRRTNMQQVTIDAVRSHPTTGQYLVILKDAAEHNIVIWIGKAEAMTIAEGLNEISPQRPMAAHLMANVFKATGIQLAEVRIATLKHEIFYAIIKVRHNGTEHEIDARPSDALSLAVLLNAPIFVSTEIIEYVSNATTGRATIPLTEYTDVGREAILQAREDTTTELQKLIASLGQSAAHAEKEEREKAKQQLIAEWKEERKKQQ